MSSDRALVTGVNLRKKAKKLFIDWPFKSRVQGMGNWMSRPLRRQNFSLRCTTTKSKKIKDQTKEIQKKVYLTHKKSHCNIPNSPQIYKY